MVKVPEVKRCCFCCPLRQGILFFGIINIVFSLAAVAWLVFTTELKKANFIDGSLEVATATVLFSIFGMSVILNILLLIAGCLKDMNMLRLFNCYAVATTLAAMVPTIILLSRAMYYDAGVAFFAIIPSPIKLPKLILMTSKKLDVLTVNMMIKEVISELFLVPDEKSMKTADGAGTISSGRTGSSNFNIRPSAHLTEIPSPNFRGSQSVTIPSFFRVVFPLFVIYMQ